MQDTTFTLELKSNPMNISFIEPYVNKVVETYNIDYEMYGNILISLTEAVNNAIIHGNKYDDKKLVTVSMMKDEKKIAFFVTDQGKGFRHGDLPDPTAPENILKLGGRGVFLMRQLADLVVFSNNGSTVEVHFKF